MHEKSSKTLVSRNNKRLLDIFGFSLYKRLSKFFFMVGCNLLTHITQYSVTFISVSIFFLENFRTLRQMFQLFEFVDLFISCTDTRVWLSSNDQWSISLNVIIFSYSCTKKYGFQSIILFSVLCHITYIKIIYTLLLELTKRGGNFYDRRMEGIVTASLEKNIMKRNSWRDTD